MKRRGFTLIELLAVIVILAIIALIVTPIMMNVIGKAREESEKRSIDLYASAINNAISTYQLKNLGKEVSGLFTTEDGTILIAEDSNTELTVEYNGNVVCDKILVLKNGKVYLSGCEVNGDAVDYSYDYGINKPKSFAEDSWETIAENVEIGNISAYKVGDMKEITLTGFTNTENDAGTYTLRIANTSTPEECNQSIFSQSSCGFVIEFEDIITKKSMNSTNVEGWPASTMRTYVNDTIYNALPQELKDNIIETKVVSSHGSFASSNFISTDKLYLLSTKEVWGKEGTEFPITKDTAEAETRQLDYYKEKGVTVNTRDFSGAVKKYNGSAAFWWLRSAYLDYKSLFFSVGDHGNWNYGSGAGEKGVAPAFRIG